MRTFVAIDINEKNVLNSLQKLKNELKINAKSIDLDKLHFTLLFLGEIPDKMSHKVQDALSTLEFSPFKVTFKGIGAFPNTRKPRIVWIGVEKEGGQHLIEISKKVQQKLAPLGYKSDKQFKPHITMFRIKNRIGDISEELKKYESSTFGMQEISEIKFKQSVLTPNGPIYSDLQVILAK